jgi:ATP-dependent Zn protease
MREPGLLATAYQEAGHVVIAWRVGLKLKSATIVPGDHAAGYMKHAPQFKDITLDFENHSARGRAMIEDTILVLLAGRIAHPYFSNAPMHCWRKRIHEVDPMVDVQGNETDFFKGLRLNSIGTEVHFR